jgi:hypothetical protein
MRGLRKGPRKHYRKRMKMKPWCKKTQAIVQKLYKEVPEVPLVIEATMEEQLLNIGEFNKGFRDKI